MKQRKEMTQEKKLEANLKKLKAAFEALRRVTDFDCPAAEAIRTQIDALVEQARILGKNREKLRKYNRKWREAHPEYGREWREANPEKLKAYLEAHREKRNKYQRDYMRVPANREKRNETARKWREANREKVREYNREYARRTRADVQKQQRLYGVL
jgi:hypothetical protein